MLCYNIMTSNTCRLCLDTGAITDVFEKRGEEMISTKVMTLAKVKIYPNDGFPDKVCYKCLLQLNSCLDFVQQCERVDLKLREIKKEVIYQDSNEHDTNNDKSVISLITPKTEDAKDTEEVLKEVVLEVDVSTEDSNMCGNTESLPKKEKSKFVYKKKKRNIQKQQCFTCGKVLSSMYRLKMHLRTHTGEKPYACRECFKRFSQPENLKVHLRIHTGEKPLECPTCGLLFAHSSGLLAHKRKHTGQLPYQCSLCPRSFRTSGHFQYHIRRHTGETSHDCDVCSRAFITRTELKQHILSHTKEKHHVCSTCGASFGRAANLRRHIHHQHSVSKAPKGPLDGSFQKRDLNGSVK